MEPHFMEKLGGGYDAPAGHEKAAVMDLISKYKVDPSSYLGGRDPDKEYLRRILFAPPAISPQTNQRRELSDRLNGELASKYQLTKGHFSSLYSNSGLYGGLGKYN